jgi:outer membrane protein assembly factor BamD (BamD/ComL family)
MGRKSTRDWQYFFLCIVSLIIIYCCGCTSAPPLNKSTEDANKSNVAVNKCSKVYQQVLRTEQLLAQNNFKAAIAENRQILLSVDSNLPKDEALFSIGLIYAHDKIKSYKKSIGAFKKLMHDYPNSPFVEQAKVWTEVLQTIQDSQNKIGDLQKIIQDSQNKIDDLQKKNEGLENIIENLETVDTELDQKRKNKSN